MDAGQDDAETNTATERPRFAPAEQEDVVAPAQRIGRFMVLGRVGSGGMGQVYAAYDPTLDRRVALKLLHAEQSEKDRSSLMHEAKALARLSHPNVVAVYDVGVHRGSVFLAMEFIEGMTLKEWASRTQGADPTTALDLLAQAGRGLDAAHKSGLVHGDVKPHNVLVGQDGRARVVDFGLARTAAARGRERTNTEGPTLSDSEASDQDSGRVIAGTPAYMAPEHARRGTVDARTDQYSFCVTAWEVLHGVRPPAASDVLELPDGLSSALKKGLSDRPLTRHRSLAPVLRALESAGDEFRGHRARRLRSWLVSGGVAAVVAAVAGGYWLGRGDDAEQPCTGADAELAKVWDENTSAAVSAALLATGAPYAEHTDAAVRERLDAYGKEWSAGYTEACEASVVRREQSTAVMDARMLCLTQRRQELGGVVKVLRAMDDTQVEFAMRVLDGLTSPRHCEDLAYVQSSEPVPAAAELRSSVAAVRETLAEIDAIQNAGRYADAESGARAAVGKAKELGFRPLEAEAQLRLGRALDMLGRDEDATAAAKSAFLSAQTADRDSVALHAALVVSLAAGLEGNDKGRALLWSDIALALSQRLEPDPGPRVAKVLDARAAVMRRHGGYEAAHKLYDRSLELYEEGSMGYASALEGRGGAKDSLGDTPGAIGDREHALSIYSELLGVRHPTIAATNLNLSSTYIDAGRYEDARAAAEQATAIYLATEGPNGRGVASALSAMGIAVRHLGDPDRALSLHQDALRILDSVLGPRHIEVGAEQQRRGIALSELGQYEEALAAFAEATEIAASELGASHPFVANTKMETANILAVLGKSKDAQVIYQQLLNDEQARETPSGLEGSIRANLGLLLSEQEEFKAALEQYTRVLELARDAPQSFAYQMAVADIAEIYLALDRPHDALENGEELLRLSNEDPTVVAQAKFIVARAEWRTKGDRDRARRLASEAATAYADVSGLEVQLAEVRAWQDAHP